MESAIAHVIEEGEQRTSDVASGSISFDELHMHREILKGLRSHRFLTPTKIQAAAIPMVLAGMGETSCTLLFLFLFIYIFIS